MVTDWKNLTYDELLDEASKLPGGEPVGRWLGLIESNRRLIAEMKRSGQTMTRLTWVLVILTVVLVIMGIATLVAAA